MKRIMYWLLLILGIYLAIGMIIASAAVLLTWNNESESKGWLFLNLTLFWLPYVLWYVGQWLFALWFWSRTN